MTPDRKMEKRFSRKEYYLILCRKVLLIIIISLVISPLSGKNKETRGLETVVIDAGHGGKDPGAMVGKIREKDIVLAIALRLGNLIREKIPGVKVVFTRSTDNFVPLFERSVIANKNNADLFISIHANFCAAASIKGTETYVLGLHRTEDNLNVAKKENSVILLEKDYSTRYEGFNPNLSESYIMFELIQDANIDQSVEFAGILQDRFQKHAQRASRDVRQAGFLVLRESAMPSVLIETGYLSNKSEAAYLMSEAGRKTLALAIFDSFKSYKEKFESRLNQKYTNSSKKDLKDVSKTAVADLPTAEEPKNIDTLKPSQKPTIRENPPVVKESKQSAKKIADQITYAIQISAYPRKLPVNSKLFKGIKNISEFTFGGYFKYYCLETSSFSEAKQNLQTIRAKIPDAFVIAFKNGQPVPIKEVLKTR